MSEREKLLYYISRLSDARIHRVAGCANVNYAIQKDSEPVTHTAKSRLAGLLALCSEEQANALLTFAEGNLICN